jgi:hypothetical protein
VAIASTRVVPDGDFVRTKMKSGGFAGRASFNVRLPRIILLYPQNECTVAFTSPF